MVGTLLEPSPNVCDLDHITDLSAPHFSLVQPPDVMRIKKCRF